jgi:hypothetical protein
MTGNETILAMREQTDTILLAFSSGKDSVGAWLECRKYFPRIIPFHMYVVPELEFIEDNLRYYEKFFETRIHRIPHPSLYRMLRECVFQPPPNWPVIQAANLPRFDYFDSETFLREELGLPDSVYVATGVRSADSLQRRLAIEKAGSINHKLRKFYPIHDWKKADLIREFQTAGIQLPSDYAVWPRSLDGVQYQYLAGMKEHFPRDYARVLEYFPLAGIELQRREYAERHRTESVA